MKIFDKIKKTCLLLVVVAVSFTACNKLDLDAVPNTQPTQATTPTLATLLDDPSFSLLKAAVTKAGLLPTLGVPTLRFTIFAPDDAAITASLTPILPPGVTPALYIASLTPEAANALISYHVIPQVIPAASIPGSFPNFQYPTLLNPAPSISALLRLTTFPSVRSNGAWVNNVPIIATDIQAVNGVLHKVFRVIAPPQRFLWDTAASTTTNPNFSIFADPNLSFLKAAIIRADSGVAAGGRLLDALTNIGANLTIFAPTDDAMKAFLIGAITRALVGQGLPANVAQGQATFLVTTYGILILTNPYLISPVLGAVITPTLAKGIVAYHVLSAQSGTYAPPGIRVFSVNLPSTPMAVKTLLNSAVTVHPGVIVQAMFVSPVPGVSVVTDATVKGAANATASNIIVGPTTSDLHFVNGVMHKIDQVLLPQ